MPEREFVSVLDTCENDVYKLVYSVGLRVRYQCGRQGFRFQVGIIQKKRDKNWNVGI